MSSGCLKTVCDLTKVRSEKKSFGATCKHERARAVLGDFAMRTVQYFFGIWYFLRPRRGCTVIVLRGRLSVDCARAHRSIAWSDR